MTGKFDIHALLAEYGRKLDEARVKAKAELEDERRELEREDKQRAETFWREIEEQLPAPVLAWRKKKVRR